MCSSEQDNFEQAVNVDHITVGLKVSFTGGLRSATVGCLSGFVEDPTDVPGLDTAGNEPCEVCPLP